MFCGLAIIKFNFHPHPKNLIIAIQSLFITASLAGESGATALTIAKGLGFPTFRRFCDKEKRSI